MRKIMKEYKISIRQGDIFYYGLVGAVLFNYMLESSSIKNFNDSLLHDIALVFALISASLCVILRKYSLREFIGLHLTYWKPLIRQAPVHIAEPSANPLYCCRFSAQALKSPGSYFLLHIKP